MSWLKLLLKSIGFAWENRKTIRKAVVAVQDVVDPEPNHGSHPLTHKEVEHIQAQIKAGVSHGTVQGKVVLPDGTQLPDSMTPEEWTRRYNAHRQ